jgi:hypothetical protein
VRTLSGNIKSFEKPFTHSEVVALAERTLKRFGGDRNKAGRYARGMEDRYESAKWAQVVEVLATSRQDHAVRKTGAQLDAEIADILAGPTVGPGSFQPGQRVKCSYRGEHAGKVLSLDDPRAWANTLAFPQDKPNRLAVKEHLLRHPTAGVKSIPVLYKFGVQWDRRDSLTPA